MSKKKSSGKRRRRRRRKVSVINDEHHIFLPKESVLCCGFAAKTLRGLPVFRVMMSRHAHEQLNKMLGRYNYITRGNLPSSGAYRYVLSCHKKNKSAIEKMSIVMRIAWLIDTFKRAPASYLINDNRPEEQIKGKQKKRLQAQRYKIETVCNMLAVQKVFFEKEAK